jgi:hypothetical protein
MQDTWRTCVPVSEQQKMLIAPQQVWLWDILRSTAPIEKSVAHDLCCRSA